MFQLFVDGDAVIYPFCEIYVTIDRHNRKLLIFLAIQLCAMATGGI